MSKKIEGIITAVVTPFEKNGNIDEAAFRKIINSLIDTGISGLFPVGSTGEFFALSMDEKRRLMDIAVEEVNGRVLVMPNAGAVTTRESIELAKYAQKTGADCISVITPYFISPNQEELYDHFKAICGAIEIPVLAYNNPGRTGGLFLKPSTVAKLAAEVPNFVGIKDSTGDMSHFLEIIRNSPAEFCAIMGRDTMILSALMAGAVGAVAATANVVPRLVVSIYEEFKAGNIDGAMQCQRRLAPLRLAFGLGSFPATVKEAMNMLGLPAGRCRSPIQPLTEPARAELRRIMTDMGLLT